MPEGKVTTIGCFRILSDLKTGSGSQGAVYKAVCEREGFEDVKPGTVVALKVMLAHDGADRYLRLKRRTDELKTLDHPNVVRYLGCFAERDAFSDVHVVVLEFLEGVSLKDRLLASPRGLDADEALDIAGQALQGLLYLSSCGIVHRDVKPGNIFVCSDGRVKLIDFEVAARDTGAATTVGGMVGTYDYMAPDFVNSDFRGDEASDIFSFSVTFHEMLTGRTPYRVGRDGDTQSTFAFMSRWSGHSDEHSAIHVSSRVRRILADADGVLQKGLAPDRAARYRSFADFEKDFAKIRFRELSYGESHWRLLLYVGRGGFGEVFKARDVATGRLVAIKHLLYADDAERFRREARIMSEVHGPHFVHLVAFFELTEKGSPSAFLVMDYLPGMPGLSLRDRIKAAGENPLPRRPVLLAFLRYARALSYLHDRGIIHRDVKPSNLYFPEKTPAQSAIMDFGVVRDVSGTETVGQMPGTLDYMPPEAIEPGYRGKAGLDVYALGLCLYEALSGKPAYPRIPPGSAGLKMFFERARAKQAPKFDASAYCDCPELVGLLIEMTEPVAARRLQSAAEVERRLASILGIGSQRTERSSERFVTVEDAPSVCDGLQTAKTIAADDAAIDLLCGKTPEPKPRKGGKMSLVVWLAVLLFVIAGGAIVGTQVYRMREAEKVERQIAAAAKQKAEEEEAAAKKAAEEEAAAKKAAEEEAAAKKAAEEAAAKRKAEEEEAAAKKAAEEEAAAKKAAEEAAAKRKAEEEKAAAKKAAEEAAAKQKAAEEEAAAKKAAEEAAAKQKAAEEEVAAKLKAEEEEAAAKKAAEEAAAKQKAAETQKAKRNKIEAARRQIMAQILKIREELKREDDAFRAESNKPGSRDDANERGIKWGLRRREFGKKISELEKRLKSLREVGDGK